MAFLYAEFGTDCRETLGIRYWTGIIRHVDNPIDCKLLLEEVSLQPIWRPSSPLLRVLAVYKGG